MDLCKDFMSDEARRYYEDGRRVLIGGVPCRVNDYRPVGVADIRKRLAGRVAVDDENRVRGAPRFRYTPAPAPLVNAKPSSRGSVTLKGNGYKPVGGWWRPTTLSLNPDYKTAMAGDPWQLTEARRAWANGNPVPLRKYLADRTANEADWKAETDRLLAA